MIYKVFIVNDAIISGRVSSRKPTVIRIQYWGIATVREHVVPEEAGAGGGVAVGIQEALDDGVVISRLQVIEARLSGRTVAIEEKKRGNKAVKKPVSNGNK